MNKNEQLGDLTDEKFRRLTGVKRETFEKMVEILRESQIKKKQRGGRPNKLCVEDILLMALEYHQPSNRLLLDMRLDQPVLQRKRAWLKTLLLYEQIHQMALQHKFSLLQSGYRS